MANVITLPSFSQELIEGDVDITLDFNRDGADKMLQVILASAICYRASEVQFHSWLGEDALAIIVAGQRYGINSIPDNTVPEFATAARRLLQPSRRQSFLEWLFGKTHHAPVVGRVTLESEHGKSEWCGVCWQLDQTVGVEFHRVDVEEIRLTSKEACENDDN